MRKFELNKDPKKLEPTQEQLNRHKDFSKLSHRYEDLTKRGKKPLYRDRKRLLLWIVIAVIIYLVLS